MRASPFSGDDPELSSERHGHLGQFFVGQSEPGTLLLPVGTLVQRKNRERSRWTISRPLPDGSFLVGLGKEMFARGFLARRLRYASCG